MALSGGVDSAVAAALLKQKGYEVRGVFMRQFELFDIDPKYVALMKCSQDEDRESAQAAAQALGIPFEVWDFRNIYHKKVVEYVFAEYKEGRTPNPDCMCNTYVKFGAFLDRAKKEKADFIATGHYVRKSMSSRAIRLRQSADGAERNPEKSPVYNLTIAQDTNKDQSYFLYSLTQKQLKHCLFPLGNLTKGEVRAIAKKINLPNWNKKDSQGICFVGDVPMREFLRARIPPKEGPVITTDGKVIGTHQGAAYYTIGQRHGLGLPGGDLPYYVARIDIKKNTLIVARGETHPALFKKELRCKKVHWISGSASKKPFSCRARIRYRQPLQQCHVSLGEKKGIYNVYFSKPQRAVTSGQVVVFYQGTTMLGGGIIA
ncbi:tRNA 2-thiouridine(34) synthase MnmA [Candidatus Uhrbacteria bacterium]|nr:tRNA 2-thiouridine(34) synthase MnmA [Candidatus Uhrbacteria bacterium]